MVSRSAFTQLRYSTALLLLTTALMLVVLLSPVIGVALAPFEGGAAIAGGAAWLAMSLAYLPMVRFYRLGLPWALTLPFAAVLFLAMTWSSAVGYWRGTQASWKNRSYDRSLVQR